MADPNPAPPLGAEASAKAAAQSLVVRLRYLRPLVQLAALAFFVFLTIELAGVASAAAGRSFEPLPSLPRLFLDADPLIAVSTVLATGSLYRGLIWAVVVIVLTILLGRVFCGWLCPLGTLNHFSGWLGARLKGARRIKANRQRPYQRLKYYLLAGFLAAALSTSVQAGLLDPLCLLTRSLALVVFPLWRWLVEGTRTFYAQAWLVGGVFLAVLLLNRLIPRLWCRALCPLGALLGACGRFSLLRLEKNEEKCNGCNLCLKHCQGACGPDAKSDWTPAECHACFNCQAACPEGALAFKFLPRNRERTEGGLDLDRRLLLGSAAAGAGLLFLPRISAAAGAPAANLIRPPGALGEAAFLERCVRCGACMRACPNRALQPALFQAGLEGFWTPLVVPRLGFCDATCTLCGEACPTGAIRRLEPAERGLERPDAVRIGLAQHDRGRCLPWAYGEECSVCEEVCPRKAIRLLPHPVPLRRAILERADPEAAAAAAAAADGHGEAGPFVLATHPVPVVDRARCIGCGQCEHKCPLSGRPAVFVNALNESRR